MSKIRMAAGAAGICLLAHGGLAQQPRAQKNPQATARTARSDYAEDDQLRVGRAVAVVRVRGFAERVLAFRDVNAKVHSLVGLGDALWERDEPYARQLFLKAHEVLQGIKPSEKPDDGPPGEAGLTRNQLLDLRGDVVEAVARRDATLARRLADADAKDARGLERVREDQRAAMSLLEDGNLSEAVAFAQHSMSEGVPRGTVGFLLQLRRRDEAAADALFVDTMRRLTAEPYVDGMRLMEMGVYLFTSPYSDPSIEERGAMVFQSVGGVGVINLSADRPGISPAVVRAYLAASTQILTRPVADPQQKRLYYAATCQLLPKAQRLAPELAPTLAAAAQSLMPDLPSSLTQPTAFDALKPKQNYSFDDTLRGLDSIDDPAMHDMRCLMIVDGLLFSKDFARARLVAEKAKDSAVRGRVLNLIAAGEASKALQGGETGQAEETAAKLSPGVERTLLWLAVARAREKEGDRARALEASVAALKDARRVADARQPYLLLGAAGELAKLDPPSALQTLNEAVKAFNAGSGQPAEWYETVEAGGREFNFRLWGVEEDGVGPAVRRLYAVDAAGTESTLLNIKHEQILGRSLRALSESILAAAPAPKTH